MTEQEKILEKIRKLHEHAESAAEIGSEAEAQAFAAKVQELLTEYKLSMKDVHRAGTKEANTINAAYVSWQGANLKVRNRRMNWAEFLGVMVCDAYYCKFVISGRGGRIGLIIGSETDRNIATYVYYVILRFMDLNADKETRKYQYRAWKEGGTPTGGLPEDAKGFKKAWLTGFLVRLKQRLEEEIVNKRDDSEAQRRRNAIVHIKRDALVENEKWMSENLKTQRVQTSSLQASSIDGYLAGKKAANQVSVHGNGLDNFNQQGLLR